MPKYSVVGTLAISVFFALPVSAHHGHDHHETPAPTPAPVAAAPPPPPPPPAPPPVVQAPVLPQIQVNLPVVLQNIVPTDVAGLAGSLGNAIGIKEQLGIPGSKPAKQVTLIARDSRYQFSGDWISFAPGLAAKSPSNETHAAGRHEGRIEQWDIVGKSKTAAFMPTKDAVYDNQGAELSLESGAVLVRAETEPAFVNLTLDGHKITVRVTTGLALVANLDNKPVILNLTDRCCGAVAVYLPQAYGQRHKLNLAVGEIVEVHRKDDKPFTTYVSSKVLTKQELSESHHVQISRCHYLSALRRYNLDKALQKDDLHRVLKTAAALAYVNPGGKH